MGESIVDASNKEVKIGEMASSNPAFEVSVSFGRFENDSLSWEKWSSFSPNKYLEEVEKCATPGSVAKKKAYFEEHYKKIAARKAELQAQEKPMESKPFNSDDQNCGDLVGKSNGQCSNEGGKQETNWLSEVSNTHFDEHNEEPELAIKSQNSSAEGVKGKIDSRMESQVIEKIDSRVESEEKEEMDSAVESPKLIESEETAPDEAVLVKEAVETLPKGSQDEKELPQNSEKDIKDTPKFKHKNLKLGHLAKSDKITPANKERNETRIKKKPASPVTKTPQFSTPKASKPTSTPTTPSASRTPLKTKTTSSYSLPKTKIPSMGESKKVVPRSLHMSLSLGPSDSGLVSLPATRKSLIMEKMGDKDIVKRAFKTFQSNYHQLKPSSQEQYAASKQVPAKGREARVSTLMTPQKENGGSPRVSGMEKKNAKAAPSYFGLKTDEREDRRKEFSKKLEEKPNGREAERKYPQTKSKDNRDAEIKKLRQSLNFKATPLPGFYHGQRTCKSPLDKIGTKTDIHR
ncbi:PREDICTED: protein WVD2-like 4 isoform X1 [Theobroma cacao]|uniref:Protein WVD2-like 4 isoform X1 n=2 Tax=Theobroma cacao TaxID=3641 RepID=A0AB32VWD6_THECC|nr:PREDICTED: protein WVD2-like 4 isoform X1 [Theobroma cacao]XP_007044469.2 PREDICTED: protein WVD2-like 4 isoform X1 [Theobroma cacao]XP_017970519.1 PREDICTED: protein WVD2-like 4 isoform X1 [Theobroma cacao]